MQAGSLHHNTGCHCVLLWCGRPACITNVVTPSFLSGAAAFSAARVRASSYVSTFPGLSVLAASAFRRLSLAIGV